jgi:hypothetical protein
MLGPMARRLFEQRPESNLFTNTEVLDAIAAVPDRPVPFVLKPQLQAGKLESAVLALAPSLLRDELRDDCGLLVSAGLSRNGEVQFSFAHRSFLEYFTAQDLARQGWQAITAKIDKKAWDPRWQEVTVLLAGQLEDPVPLLSMLHKKAPTTTNPHGDDYFRHRLALAAQCLPEAHSALLRLQQMAWADTITAAAFSAWWKHQRNFTTALVPHLVAVLPALGQVNAQVGRVQFLEQLAQLLRDPREDVQGAAAGALGGLGNAVPPEVVAQLVQLLRDPQGTVRAAAARALGGLGNAVPPEVVAQLAQLLRDPKKDVRGAAAEALGGLGNAVLPEVVAQLVQLLRDPEKDVRGAAAWALGALQARGYRIFESQPGAWEVKTVRELSTAETERDREEARRKRRNGETGRRRRGKRP